MVTKSKNFTMLLLSLIYLLSSFYYSYAEAKVLNDIPYDLVEKIKYGFDLILHRDYKNALKLFKEDVGPSYPYDSRGPLGEVIVYQIMMLEGEDFKFDKDYHDALRRVKEKLEIERKIEGETAWYHFQKAAINGIDGLYNTRKNEWWKALRRGMDALEAIEKVIKLNPNLYDAYLGLGIYHYYRSIAKKKVWYLPIFGDYRKQGIEEIERSMAKGKVVNSFAKIALVYVNISEKKYKKALELSLELKSKYPKNVLIKMLTGKLYRENRKYDEAIKEFHEVLTIDKDQAKALYQLGLTLYYKREDLNKAEEYFNKFLITNPNNIWKGYTYYRLGQIYYARNDIERAIDFWKKALKYNPDHKGSKSSLAYAKKKLKKQKKSQNNLRKDAILQQQVAVR